MLKSHTVSTPEIPSSSASADDLTIDASPRAAARLLVLPAVVAGVIVVILALYFAFGALTRETRSVDSYLAEVRSAEGNRRWQAAYELSRLLEAEEAGVGPGTAATAILAFREAAGANDPRVRRYLTLTLGKLKDPTIVPELIGALKDSDPETRIYASLALGRTGDRRATPALGAACADEDPGVRKAAAYALGAIADPASSAVLREALHDQEVDVTWNAAVALARLGDPSGSEVLRSMADREFVERASQSEDPATRSTVLVTAIQGLVMIEDQGAVAGIERLAARDPDLRVRQAAIDALAKLSRPARPALTSKVTRVQ